MSLSEQDREAHVCCVKPHLCRDDHFHERDVETLIANAVNAALTEAAERIEERRDACQNHGCSEFRPDGCASQFCRTYMQGQTEAAHLVRDLRT